MKKIIITIAAIAAMSFMTVSCKNTANAASKCGEQTECCGNHEGGECTKAEGEKCEKCLEAEANGGKHECKGEGHECNHEGGEHQCSGGHTNCQHKK